MSLFLVFFTAVQFFIGFLLNDFSSAARGLLGGIIGIHLFNCLSYATYQSVLLDVKGLLSIQIIAFGISNFFGVSFLPSLLPLVYCVADVYFPL